MLVQDVGPGAHLWRYRNGAALQQALVTRKIADHRGIGMIAGQHNQGGAGLDPVAALGGIEGIAGARKGELTPGIERKAFAASQHNYATPESPRQM